jgi:hypothetical protein
MSTGIGPRLLVTAIVLAAAPGAVAQVSESFRVSDGTFNSGGHADPAGVMTSASFRVSLDAIGDGVSGLRSPGGASYRVHGGFVDAYSPPAEVVGVHWIDRVTAAWSPARSAGIYSIHSGSLEVLRGSGSPADCLATGIAGTGAVVPQLPSAGTGRFYLVSARNHVGEEGSRGSDSNGVERPRGTDCP